MFKVSEKYDGKRHKRLNSGFQVSIIIYGELRDRPEKQL